MAMIVPICAVSDQSIQYCLVVIVVCVVFGAYGAFRCIRKIIAYFGAMDVNRKRSTVCAEKQPVRFDEPGEW